MHAGDHNIGRRCFVTSLLRIVLIRKVTEIILLNVHMDIRIDTSLLLVQVNESVVSLDSSCEC